MEVTHNELLQFRCSKFEMPTELQAGPGLGPSWTEKEHAGEKAGQVSFGAGRG